MRDSVWKAIVRQFAASDLACDEQLVLPGICSFPSSYERTLELMRCPIGLQPTTPFCTNDDIALARSRRFKS